MNNSNKTNRMKYQYTPQFIQELAPNEIFVFGSNLAGMHGGGAARFAYEKFGAVWGEGVGLHGQTYAIPTMQGGTDTIRPYVDEFIDFARKHPEYLFLVTPIGCGIAGFREDEIAPLFKEAIGVENIVLPEAFVIVLSPKCILCKEDLYDQPNLEYLFFWGHHAKANKITKACLSQWYPSLFTVEGVQYHCAEQFMMAEKARIMNDEETRMKILNSSDPQEIKALGKEVKNFSENKWNRYKAAVVIKGNFHKFMDNGKLRNFLLNTGNKVLVEASPYDTIWGIGLKEDHPDCLNARLWRGSNLLGFCLMEVRKCLQKMEWPALYKELNF